MFVAVYLTYPHYQLYGSNSWPHLSCAVRKPHYRHWVDVKAVAMQWNLLMRDARLSEISENAPQKA